MIIVSNLKAGVGCTTITYSIGRLLNLNIYVEKDSFLLNKDLGLKNIYKTTSAAKKDSIIDIGSNLKKVYNTKLIQKAEVAVIPLELSYESIIKTKDTIKYIHSKRYEPIDIVLILNRLDKHDSQRDFNYKNYLLDIFKNNGININIYHRNNHFHENNITLTYLRNSYGIFAELENGKYFLDRFKRNEFKRNELIDDRIFKKWNRREYDEILNRHNKQDFLFFKYLMHLAIEKVDYRNINIYNQEKDMTVFRNMYQHDYTRKELYEINIAEFDKITNTLYFNKEKKLIKDMGFIVYAIQSRLNFFFETDYDYY